MFRLASLLLLLLLTYQFIAQAVDTQSILPRDESNCNCVDGCSKRTLFNIIWGCVSTTIICAWTTVHPNIPPREQTFKATLRRLELMVWTIIAPEILPAWALNQRLAAMRIRDMYNSKKGYKRESSGFWKTVKKWFSWHEIEEAGSQAWTLKHGHFVAMGGIHLVEPVKEATGTKAASDDVVSTPSADAEKGRPTGKKPKPEKGRVTILTLEILEELLEDPEIEIEVTEDEIAHTSKGDALSKAIFILQSSWFVTQCIARLVQGLNLTQLELTTVALASLNGITFLLWWDKPLGAQTVVRVFLKRSLERRSEPMIIGVTSARSSLVPLLHGILEGTVTTIREITHCQSKGIFVAWLIQLPLAIVTLFLFPIFAFASAFACTIGDLAMEQSTSIPAEASHVPTFYVPEHSHPKWLHALLLMVLGSFFGAIHCAAWNFPFPTYAEQKLWRVASLAVTIIPITTIPIGFITFKFFNDLAVKFKSNEENKTIMDVIKAIIRAVFVFVIRIMATIPFIIFALMYASTRLVLLGQAIALLRHLPPSAFIAVDWTKFYAHIS